MMGEMNVVPIAPTKPKFKPGDEVWLVTEGPIMAVEKCDQEWVHCIWFDDAGNGTVREKFPLSVLKRYVEPKPVQKEKPPSETRGRRTIVFTPSWNRKKPKK